MATFARPTFSAKNYAAFRPSYPASLFRTVLSYHYQQPHPHPQQLQQPQKPGGGGGGGGGGLLLDIGCGHGLIARALAPHFDAVVAIDPSEGMVAQAREMTRQSLSSPPAEGTSSISFRQGSAEDLGFLGDGAVDAAVAGQAAHWFDYARAWPELARVVRPGGTLAFWGYKDNVFVGAERATAVMERFVYGVGEVARVKVKQADGEEKEIPIEGMGGFWEQPGRSILRDLLRSVVPPERDWTDVTRLEHEPGEAVDGGGADEGRRGWLRRTMRLGEVERYTRTFSCYNGWKEAHPELKSREEGGDGDVVDVMWDRMLDAMPEWKAQGERWRDIEVVNDWGTHVLMARRR
ncbi:trans-aconitate methyltransferase 1 [Diatrype stigma]|uniref:Trans-aconitate methyltransferase 1 n=1 Tax=Diatrype stigma TaxID=117547 RepID=A0AAN9UBK7_9PEZI